MDQLEVRLAARKTVETLTQLQIEQSKVSQLEQILTICAWSRKVRLDGAWVSFEEFLFRRFGVRISHGITEEAAARLLGEAGLSVRDISR